jgi:hypothetical protein
VLVVSTAWGAALGALTSLSSALAFNFFQVPPTGRFTIAKGENWVALGVFLAVALVASSVAELARVRAADAFERRREADLAAEMARLLLRTDDLRSAPVASQRLAHGLELPSAEIELDAVGADAAPARECELARPRTYRHALLELIDHEHYDQIVVAASPAGAAGFTAGDLAWLLARAPGEIVVLRPGDEAPARRHIATAA